MLTTEHPEIYLGLIDADIFRLLLDSIKHPEKKVDELAQLSWQAAGVFDENNQVDPQWSAATEAIRFAPLHLHTVSIYQDMMFNCEFFIDHPMRKVVSATTRATISPEQKIDEVHSIQEIMLGPVDQLWTLLRRGLPPMDEFRADPQPPSRKNRVEEKELASFTDDLPRVHAVITDRENKPDELKEYVWTVRDHELYRMDSTNSILEQTSVGELGWTLTDQLGVN